MTRRTKVGLFVGIVALVVVGLFMMSRAKASKAATEVRIEKVQRRDLVSAVTASGRIEAKSQVDVSADITGRVIRIGVKEGDWVTKGQFLIQIDPSEYISAVSRAEGAVASSQASLMQARASRDQAERAMQRYRQISETPDLVSREAVEQSVTAYEVAQANYQATSASLAQARAGLAQARDQLSKTRLVAPMAGRVVRLAVEEGEVAVPGTFSRETGLLVSIADLSVILATVKVDETDVIRLALGDSVRVNIDAFPDSNFVGHVTKISNSAIMTATSTAGGSSDQAVDFEVEITLDEPPADIRPDLSVTARIITDTRSQALSVPIIALTVREHSDVPSEAALGTTELRDSTPRGDTAAKKAAEQEGVFVVQNGIANFRPVKRGVAGDEHFEILNGLAEGDSVVSGTYQAIRDLKDGTRVKPSADVGPGNPGARS